MRVASNSKKSARVIKSPFADNTCKTNREAEDELGRRIKAERSLLLADLS